MLRRLLVTALRKRLVCMQFMSPSGLCVFEKTSVHALTSHTSSAHRSAKVSRLDRTGKWEGACRTERCLRARGCQAAAALERDRANIRSARAREQHIHGRARRAGCNERRIELRVPALLGGRLCSLQHACRLHTRASTATSAGALLTQNCLPVRTVQRCRHCCRSGTVAKGFLQ